MASGTIQVQSGLPSVVVDNTTVGGTNEESKTYTVSGNGVVVVSTSIISDQSSTDWGWAYINISLGNSVVYASGNFNAAQNVGSNRSFGTEATCPIAVSNGDTITVACANYKTGTKTVYRRFLCFGCTVS